MHHELDQAESAERIDVTPAAISEITQLVVMHRISAANLTQEDAGLGNRSRAWPSEWNKGTAGKRLLGLPKS